MKRLFLVFAILIVGVYAAFRLDLLHWPLFQGSQTAGAGGGASGRGGRGGDGPVAVTASDVVVKDVPITLDAIGTAQALNTVTVSSQVDGKLAKIAFTEGQDVKAGDIIAKIDPSLYQAQYDQAVAKKAQDEATLANARVDLDRYTKMAAGIIASKQQADTQRALVAQLVAQVAGDQAAIDNAKTTLDFTDVRAPIDGRTGIRQVDQGNILHASDATGIVVLTQLRPVAVIFTLAQQFLRTVIDAKAAGLVSAQALDSDNATIIDTGDVSVIDNQVDPTTGTVKIKAIFPNPALHLWPGQFVNIRVNVGKLQQAMTIPTAAVQRGPNGAYVYVLNDDGTVKQTNVVVGQQNETQAVITSGLKPPARVVTTGFARLTDGAKTRLASAAPPAADGQSDPAPDGANAAPGDPSRPPSADGQRHRGDGQGRRARGAAGAATQ